ncbi:hypothetical protein HD884_002140 [Ochrobactrum intermedium]|nr:hypothetical protein [Brucella intermedia]
MALLEFMLQLAFHFVGVVVLALIVMAGLAWGAGAARGK